MRQAIRASVLYFTIVFLIGSVLGACRTLWLQAAVGEFNAVMIELPIMLVAAWLICRWLMQRFELDRSISAALIMGCMAFILLMLAEIALSLWLSDQTIAEHLSHYRHPAGALGLAGQVVFALFPVIQALNGRRRV